MPILSRSQLTPAPAIAILPSRAYCGGSPGPSWYACQTSYLIQAGALVTASNRSGDFMEGESHATTPAICHSTGYISIPNPHPASSRPDRHAVELVLVPHILHDYGWVAC